MSRARKALGALGLAAVLGAGALAGCGGPDLDPACSAPGHMRCDGDTIVTCTGEDTTRRDCSAEGLSCAYVDSATGISCVADACALVGPLGRCVGDAVDHCTGGTLTETACPDGQACAYLDDTAGYGCRAVAEPSMVSGEIHYEDRPQTGRGPVGDLRPLPVRGATVTVVDDASQQVLATVTTADNGGYLARFTATPGQMVHITAVTKSSFKGRPITVTTNPTMVHGFGSPSFPAAEASTVDLLVTDASHESEAFNVFDQAVIIMDTLTRDIGVTAPVALRLRWARGSNDGTYFDGQSVHLLGAASDDDGYDDTVICHETGHYVEQTVGHSDSPGGSHDGQPTDPRLAWSEGFATFWGQSALGQPVYSDSNAGGGYFDNIDTETFRATGTGMTQPVSERMVSQILWDMGDKPAPDDDLLTTSSFADVNGVQKSYLHATTLRAVGTAGVDLVDFLDGWFVLQGLTTCAAMRDLVVTTHNFPYDFA
ncbi:MAG TPA: hypothetical protein VHE35_14135, partial [Kofleriaceae bacterium]|nr:hypothetical protein [Kofleriaceae bacterium]